ncbi:TPA: alcohol dehydrogenase [Candidatus Latescibacteria bacterium]|nr:alcohol dehydrogenase [Candidatus Latescibacterota bacterium]
MKKAIIEGERAGKLVEVPDPVPKENWVVVKIHSAPMCTEYKAFESGRPSASLGHEAAGEVVAVAQPARVKVGDRVAVMPQFPCGTCALCVSGEYIHCETTADFESFLGTPEGRGTYAQYIVKPDWILPALPESVSYDHGAMACCGLGPTLGAFERMQLQAGETVLITGLGPVGLGGVINASYRGARVIAVDSVPFRQEMASLLGADVVLPPGEETCEQIRELTGGVGVDRALDCSGNPLAHRLCIDATRRKGKVAFVGECSQDTAIRISPDMIRKGLSLIGSWHYNLEDYPKLMSVVQQSGDKIDRLITHRFPLSRVQEAWELQLTGECAKVVLDPWWDS